MPYTKITGAWVDGMAAPVDQAGRSLRSLLSEAEAVYLVISDGHSELRSVTVHGRLARRLAELVTEPDDAVSDTVTDTPFGARPVNVVAREDNSAIGRDHATGVPGMHGDSEPL